MTSFHRPEAEDDILVAARWLDTFNPGAGARFVEAVDACLLRLLSHPGLFVRVNRPPRGRVVRQGRIPGTVFVVTYEVTPTQLVVWSVGHARLLSQPWRKRMTP